MSSYLVSTKVIYILKKYCKVAIFLHKILNNSMRLNFLFFKFLVFILKLFLFLLLIILIKLVLLISNEYN